MCCIVVFNFFLFIYELFMSDSNNNNIYKNSELFNYAQLNIYIYI